MIAIYRPAKNNYDLAVDNGFTGSLAEWLESLRGDPGHSNLPTPNNLCRIEVDPDEVTVTLSDIEGNPITKLPYIP